jgi:uncharacterized FAD-dependent dehydrogenase
LGYGVGGSGLYSDGKFSFYPSASDLWRLPDYHALHDGYLWLAKILSSYGMNPPPLSKSFSDTPHVKERNGIFLKKYASFYMSLDNRKRLISYFEGIVKNCLKVDTLVTKLLFNRERERWLVRTCSVHGDFVDISARAVIYTGGRTGPVDLFKLSSKIPKIFRRLEMGVRIEQPSESFFLKEHPQLDPKLIFRTSADCEFRTFCCCREGEVVTLVSRGFKTVAGRGDCGPTGISNVGFNLRINDEDAGASAWRNLQQSFSTFSRSLPIRERLSDFVNVERPNQPIAGSMIAKFFGSPVAQWLAQGLTEFSNHLRLEHSKAVLVAPALEAVAYYPSIDENLRVLTLPMWIAGDSTGLFRGLTAALVSGHYVATQTNRYLNTVK